MQIVYSPTAHFHGWKVDSVVPDVPIELIPPIFEGFGLDL